MRFTIIALVIILTIAGAGHCSEVRPYVTKSRLVIENGYAYKINSVLYTELYIEGTSIVKRTYEPISGGKRLVSEDMFVATPFYKEGISNTMPKWIRKIKKFFGAALPPESEHISRATNIDEVKGLKARSLVILTIGDSFLIEVDTQCPHPPLALANIIEYRYYEKADKKCRSVIHKFVNRDAEANAVK